MTCRSATTATSSSIGPAAKASSSAASASIAAAGLQTGLLCEHPTQAFDPESLGAAAGVEHPIGVGDQQVARADAELLLAAGGDSECP